MRRGLKEAAGKSPARGTRSAYEATTSGREGQKIQSPIVIREGVGVDATGIWGEGVCAIHGEICPSAIELIPLRGGVMEGQKSAEGIVVSSAFGTKA